MSEEAKFFVYHRVNGCVGVANYRYYIQFLCYVTLLGTWIFSTSLAAFIMFNSLVREKKRSRGNQYANKMLIL